MTIEKIQDSPSETETALNRSISIPELLIRFGFPIYISSTTKNHLFMMSLERTKCSGTLPYKNDCTWSAEIRGPVGHMASRTRTKLVETWKPK